MILTGKSRLIAVLLIFGAFVAILSFYADALWSSLTHAAESNHSALAQACTLPEVQTDEIFFISCGGIY